MRKYFCDRCQAEVDSYNLALLVLWNGRTAQVCRACFYATELDDLFKS